VRGFLRFLLCIVSFQAQARESELQEELLLAQHARGGMERSLSHRSSDLSAQLALLRESQGYRSVDDGADVNYVACDLACGSLVPSPELKVRPQLYFCLKTTSGIRKVLKCVHLRCAAS
jgi:hypothetical protein